MKTENDRMVQEGSIYRYCTAREYNASFPQEAEVDLANVRKITGNDEANLVRGASNHTHTAYSIMISKAGAKALAKYHQELADTAFASDDRWAMDDWRRHTDTVQHLLEFSTEEQPAI